MFKNQNTKHSQRVPKFGSSYLRSIRPLLSRFVKSIWFLPTILLVPLFLFTAFQINGSSIGVYHKFFNGDPKAKDSNLILGEPRPIRGDEWNFTTQIAISQSKNNFNKINNNIGEGLNLSILEDVPYKDWSIIFKPHNLVFFILPFENAFAFKWWSMLYLLIIACYFFILCLLPRKHLLAAILAIGFAFNPLIQWWYLYGTLGSLYYTLFLGVIIIHLLKARQNSTKVLWGLLLTYILVCFALVLYPPFQIPCALAMIAFLLGYFIEQCRKKSLKSLLPSVALILGAGVVSLMIVFAYITTRQEVVHALANTSYPGARVVHSGNYNLPHLLSGQLSHQLQNPKRIMHYGIGGNESEASTFVFLLPFLFIPGVWLLVRGYRNKKKVDWPLLTTSVLFVLFLVRLFIPHTDLVFKFLFLGSIPHERLLIGIGLLSLIHMILVIRNVGKIDTVTKYRSMTVLYSLLVWIICLSISIYIYKENPGYIGAGKAILLSIPIPLVTYLLLSKRFTLGAIILSSFLLFSSAGVNPLYRGLSVVTDTPLSKAIQDVNKNERGIWATESYLYEEFPMLNNARSLTGVYPYPQLSLWKDSGAPKDLYNRYAHINLLVDRDINRNIKTHMTLPSPDSIAINTEPCSKFLRDHKVQFILTSTPIPDACVKVVKKVTYPSISFYIYKINYPSN